MTSGSSHTNQAEVATLFERLRREIAQRPAVAPGQTDRAGDAGAYAAARDEAERYRAVTADRRFLYKPGALGRARGLVLAPLKSVLRKLMRWYVEPALAQQRDFNSAVLQALDALSERTDFVSERLTEQSSQTAAELEAVNASVVRSLDEIAQRLLRVERRERRPREPAAHAAGQALAVSTTEPDYFVFEARMRGSTELIRARQTIYVDEFREAAPVLDVGCGRGEFLALLHEAGVEARGIDADSEMVEYCRAEGLNVEFAEASAYLAGLENDSLGGVFCAHVVEHLDPHALFGLLELCVAKLRPSGLLVAETPNPLSLVALANFSADLSHVRPVHPETLSFLAQQVGFHDVRLRFVSELSDEDKLGLVPLPQDLGFSRAQEILNADIKRLNEVVFGPQDYAMLARA